MNELVVILDNVRSSHNVGSILRTCDGFGVTKLIACGLTPYPKIHGDKRLPHISKRAHEQIAKTALGAENNISIQHLEKLDQAVQQLRTHNYKIWAIEQTEQSAPLNSIKVDNQKIAIVLGHELNGVDLSVQFDKVIEIPMSGKKESFNVAVTAGIVIYHLTMQ